MWQQWIFGRRVESEVAEALKSLPTDYVLLNDLILPEGRVKVDHVVVGPNGLFAIKTKDCAGDVRCEGHDWCVNRRRIPSFGQEATLTAAALRKILVSATYDGEKKIPVVSAVLVFTNPEAELSVREPAVPAMKVEELAAFILHYRVAEITQQDQQAMVRHLISFQSSKNHRKSFLGTRGGRAPAPKFSGAPAAHASRSGLKLVPDSASDRHQRGRHNIDRLPDFSANT